MQVDDVFSFVVMWCTDFMKFENLLLFLLLLCMYCMRVGHGDCYYLCLFLCILLLPILSKCSKHLGDCVVNSNIPSMLFAYV